MNKLYCIFAVFSLLLAGGCKSYLDMVPEDDIEDLESIFERDASARNWFKSCYVYMNQMLPDYYANPALMGGNEFVVNDIHRRDKHFTGLAISEGLQNTYIPLANIWQGDYFYEAIRYIDIFIERVDDVHDMLESDKLMMKAEIKVLKAHIYFELLRRYGPFVIVKESFDVTATDEEMQVPRSPLDSCVNEIVKLIDDAREDLIPLNLKDITRKTYHSLESGLMLKAQTLFYAASDLFNGNQAYADVVNKDGVRLFPARDDKKWDVAYAAIVDAINVAHAGNIKLVSGVKAKITPLLTTMYDIEKSVLAPGYSNSEAIHMVRPADSNSGQGTVLELLLPRVALDGSTTHPHYNVQHLGSYSPTIEMVEKYYTENGLPIDSDPEYFDDRYEITTETKVSQYLNVIPQNAKTVALHLRREPRFYAHIAADRTYWQRGPNAQDNIIVQAYKGEFLGTTEDVFSNTTFQNQTGYWCKKFTSSDIATQNYLSSASNPEPGHIVMRLAELYLMAAEARNEMLTAPDQTVYDWINLVRERAGIPTVEESWGQIALSTLHTTKGGMRTIIRQEWDIEFAFEGMTFWNSRRWLTAASEMTKPLRGWNILGQDAEAFYRYGNGPMIVYDNNTFVSPRDYLFPIRAEEILNSGITQNLGW